MCRYLQHPVRTHFACVPCRHTAKYPDWAAARCPLCSRAMVDLGRDFKAPRRADVRQWRKVELLVDGGVRFDSCGCSGPGPRPATLADAKSQLGLRHKRAGVRGRTRPGRRTGVQSRR